MTSTNALRCTLITTLALVFISLMAGCLPTTSFDELKASQTDFFASSSGDTLKVIVSSNEAWEAKSAEDWLHPNAVRGTANGQIRMTVKVDPNFGKTERKGAVEITTGAQSVTLNVTQGFGNVDISNQQYDLKVIFHVLYNADNEKRLQEKNSPTDDLDDYYPINSTQLQGILDQVNDIYKGWPMEPSGWGRDPRYYEDGPRPFTNLNLRFSLATQDPEGKQLTPAGIIRHEITDKDLAIEAVMDDKPGGTYYEMGFPVSRYINVYIFPFRPDGDPNLMTLGVAHLPHAPGFHPIEGLAVYDKRVDKFPNYNHCVVINSKIFEPLQQLNLPQGKDTPYKTIAHELGHIVGLMHVFGEEVKDKGLVMANSCIDSDHVKDTGSYNRVAYQAEFSNAVATNNNTIDLNNSELMRTLRSRYDCEKQKKYLSTNVMDYDWTYGDRFTKGQYDRVRDVLYYCLDIPGFKIENPSPTKAGGLPDAEPRAVKCTAFLGQGSGMGLGVLLPECRGTAHPE